MKHKVISTVECFYVLNTWDDKTKDKIRRALDNGDWVHLGCSAIGHTRAEMTVREGIEWLMSEFPNLISGVDNLGGKCFKLDR